MPKAFKFTLVLAVLALSVLGPQRAGAEETKSFQSEIRLAADSGLSVTETIVEDFGSEEHHGLFRVVPVKYDRHKSTYTVSLHVTAASVDGATTPVKTSSEGRNVKIRLGNPDHTVQGVHTYRLSYSVRRAINYFNGRPELYWNAVPAEWPFPIAQAGATFYPPKGVSTNSLKVTSFVGRFSGTQPAKTTIGKGAVSFRAANLNPQEGLTVTVQLPVGSVETPAKDRIAAVFSGWFLALLLPLLTLGGVLTRWWSVGRDDDGGHPTAVEWQPPKDLTPAEVGALVDERVDMADIVSTVVDLAARGFLHITMEETKTLLFFSNRDYTFTRADPVPDTSALKPHELAFFAALFASGRVVTLSDLKNKFYTSLPGIRKAIYDELTQQGLFHGNPDHARSIYIGLGIVLCVLAFVGLMVKQGQMWPMWMGIALSGVVVAVSARAMPAKTAAGSLAFREAKGFQRFVKMAEKRRIEVLAKDDPTLFGRLLPYAMVLGVADQWANAFQDLMHEPPSWFTGPYGYGYGNAFSPHTFINDLGGGMQTMGSTFSSAPSSAGSGGSGFSGGGVGGGFGGGGGGSW
jgi:uncharacterized membrane protein